MGVVTPLGSRTDLIVDRIRDEMERVGLEDPSLRKVTVAVMLNASTGGVRAVVVTRETEG